MVHVFEKHVEEANRFIKDLALQLGSPADYEHASRVLRSVFIALRSRIVPEESMHLISQLPLVLKGIYIDGWNIHQPLSNAKTLEQFLFEIRNNTIRNAGVDFANDDEAIEKVSAVFSTLKEYLSEGQLEHIRAELPPEIAGVIA